MQLKNISICALITLFGCSGTSATECIPVVNNANLEDLIVLNSDSKNSTVLFPVKQKDFSKNSYDKVYAKRIFPGFHPVYEVKLYDLANLPNPATTALELDDDTTLLARLIFGEARGETKEFKKTIAYTVLNRTGKHKWWGHTLKEVILKPFQYSCFNKNNPNYEKVLNPLASENLSVWRECMEVAIYVLTHPEEDTSNGATHYHTSQVKPAWSLKKKPVKILRHKNSGKTLFYKLDR